MVGTRARFIAVAVLAVAAAAPLTSTSGAAGGDPSQIGQFSPPFEEHGGTCVTDADGRELCKPAGATQVVLANGRVLFWDALEGTENINLSILAEAGATQRNDRSRTIDLSGPTPRIQVPDPEDGGANPNGAESEYLPYVPHQDLTINDGDLFCSDQLQLADGRILTVGGSDWYSEPYYASIAGHDYGLPELEGLKASRIFDPYTETWSQTGSMHYHRWYPSLITLPDGKVLVAGGTGKLLKPIYPDRPLDSGTNVRQLETYDPATGQWTVNGPTANRSLPLFPRLHLLPDGHVYYDAAGQVFNPMGESFDEAFWNIAASYDPSTGRWTDLGVPGLGLGALPGLPDLPGRSGALGGLPVASNLPLDGLPNAGGDLTGIPGFRGSAMSIMLPLKPDEHGDYSRAEFLAAGGILGTTPGTYLASSSSQINSVSMDAGKEHLSSRATGSLNAPRWYGTGVLLPTGEVMVFSGADKDEVLLPGTEMANRTTEMFDPATETWRPMAQQSHSRTYHNTAVLLPDGRVLVGGHAPISTLYSFNVTLPGGFGPNEGRDPSFEIYSPPYLFRGDRPVIAQGPGRIDTGDLFTVTLGSEEQAKAVQGDGTVLLMRNTAETHLIDGDQRSVELRIIGREGAKLTVAAPPNENLAPAGPYLLFVNLPTEDGPIPSVARQVFVDAPVPAAVAPPAGPPAKASQPVVPRAPQDVLVHNLQRALGGQSVATHLTAEHRAVRTVPGWLVLIAAGLPMAVLVAQPPLRRRRALRSRSTG